MTALDMVGVGTPLRVDNQGWAADRWRDHLGRTAKGLGLPTRVERSRPNSDHEAFERLGIPVAYVHRPLDKHYHRPTDRPESIDPARLVETTRVLVRAVMKGEG